MKHKKLCLGQNGMTKIYSLTFVIKGQGYSDLIPIHLQKGTQMWQC